MIRVRIVARRTEIELNEDRIIAGELLKKLGISIEEAVIVRNGEIITEDDEIKDGDTVEIFPVASGG